MYTGITFGVGIFFSFFFAILNIFGIIVLLSQHSERTEELFPRNWYDAISYRYEHNFVFLFIIGIAQRTVNMMYISHNIQKRRI